MAQPQPRSYRKHRNPRTRTSVYCHGSENELKPYFIINVDALKTILFHPGGNFVRNSDGIGSR